MTVSIQVTTNQKDPVYKPPPPTVARATASTATASAILTPRPAHSAHLTPIHSLVKDLLQRQRIVLSWSSLRLIISRGIYPSSSFLTTPGSTSFPSLPSTQAYYRKTTINFDNSQQESVLTAQSETVIEAPSPPTTKGISIPVTPIVPTSSSGYCTRSTSSPDPPRSADQQQLQKATPIVITSDQMVKDMVTNESISTRVEADLKDTPRATTEKKHLVEEDLMENEYATQPINEDISDMDVDSDRPPLNETAVDDPPLSGDTHHQHEDTTVMEIDPPQEEHIGMDVTSSILEEPMSVPALNAEASLFTESSVPATQQMGNPQSSTSADSIVNEHQSPITSSTPLPRPSKDMTPNGSNDPTEGESQSSITSSTLLPRPSKVTLLNGSNSAAAESQQLITSSTLLPRPSRTMKVPSRSSNVPAERHEDSTMDICESPINSSTPLPRPSDLPKSSSTEVRNNGTAPLRNSNPPIPPKRNSKLPIRASSSTPSGLLSSKRPGASPTVNKRRAIPSLFSPSNPTPVPTSPSISETKTSITRTRTHQSSPIPPPSHPKSLLTKMDHVLPTHEDDDDEEEERPKPISRKEKLARQAKRAEQIKFYRVREERDAREQRLAARRRLMAPKSSSNSDGNVSDSGSTSSSSSTYKRGKGVKFNLNRNRVIEIQQDTLDHPSGRSSRTPHSIR